MLTLVLPKQTGKLSYPLLETRDTQHSEYILLIIDVFIFRDAGIREAECERSAMDVKYSTDTKIEDNSRMFKLQKAHFDQEINTAVSYCHA